MRAVRELSLLLSVAAALGASACGGALEDAAGRGADAGAGDAEPEGGDAGSAACPPDLSSVPNAETLQGEFGLELLATNQPVAGSAALLRGRVYWGNRHEYGTVRSVSVEDCEVREVAPMMREPRSLATDDDAVYWVEGVTTRLFRYAPDTAETQELGLASPAAGLVPLGETVYSLSEDCRVMGVSKQGGDTVARSVAVGGSGNYLRGDGRSLIFACEAPNALYELVPPSTTPQLLVRTDKPITALAVTPELIVWGEDVCPDFYRACYPVVLPGCCPGRVLAYDRRTATTSTITRDPVTRPYALAADEERVWWSNVDEIRVLRLGDDTPRLVANDQSIVDAIVLDDGHAYWANPRRAGDMIVDPGYVARVPVPAR